MPCQKTEWLDISGCLYKKQEIRCFTQQGTLSPYTTNKTDDENDQSSLV